MSQFTESQIQRFDALVHQLMDEGKAAGLAVSAVNAEGDIFFERYYGWRDREKCLPIDEDTIFGIASISKSFTTLCILKLCEEGIISLDDPVSAYIPEYTCKNQSEPVRIRHFLSHAGGYYPLRRTCINEVAEKLSLAEEQHGDLAFSQELAEEGCRIVSEQMDTQNPLLGTPGEYMSYCNDGFGLLSEIIRRKGGENSFAEYVKKQICLPLGMTRSNAEFVINATDENAAVLYSNDEDQTFADHDYHRSAFVLGGGGALKSTISDFRRYLTLFLKEGKPLLQRRSYKEMLLPRVETGPDAWYCYGLSLNQLCGHAVYGHGGSLPGVSSHFAFSNDLEAGVVVLCNTEYVNVSPIAEGILRMLTGEDPWPVPVVYPGYPWPQSKINQVLGEYAKEEGGNFSLKQQKDGSLILVQGENIRPLTPISASRLLYTNKYGNGFVEIIRREDGTVCAARNGSRVFPKQ